MNDAVTQNNRRLARLKARKQTDAISHLLAKLCAVILGAIAFFIVASVVTQGFSAFSKHYLEIRPSDNGQSNRESMGAYLVDARSDLVVQTGLLSPLTRAFLDQQKDKSADAPLRASVDAYLKRQTVSEIRFRPRSDLHVLKMEDVSTWRLTSENGFGHVATRLERALEHNVLEFDQQISQTKERLQGNIPPTLRKSLAGRLAQLKKQRDVLEGQYQAANNWWGLSEETAAVLIETQDSVYQLKSVREGEALAEKIISSPKSAQAESPVPRGQWRIRYIGTPQIDRNVSTETIAQANWLKAKGFIRLKLNRELFARSDSTHAEWAGLLSAMLGSYLSMLIVMFVAIPIAMLAAIYLEEFAAAGRFKSTLEWLIQNLAATPSILFGMLGATLFLNIGGLPRGSAIIGGIVLSLVTFPVVVIAARNALSGVPQKTREGALAIGATRLQMVIDHVIPSAIRELSATAMLGVTRAIGEAAPLLVVGLAVFALDYPKTFSDPTTALPVLVYNWSLRTEAGWAPLASAAVVLLLLILLLLNRLAAWAGRWMEKKMRLGSG